MIPKPASNRFLFGVKVLEYRGCEGHMQDFVFSNTTKAYFGKSFIEKLPKEILKFGRSVLLVYGGGSIKKIGLYDKIVGLLKSSGIEITELAGVEPNPRHDTVNKGARLCRENGVDVVLAVGGGSTIDCSKGIAATAKADTSDVWDLITGEVKMSGALPLVTVLTLSATGSEMDDGAVISNMDKNLKSCLVAPCLQPAVSFLNPEYTYSVSPYQTACGSVDIISHIFDVSYFSKQEQLELSKRLQEQVVRTVVDYSVKALSNPEDYEARANLMWCSSLALNNFTYAGVCQATVCHFMEHAVSAHYDITHGHGLAIITPRWLEYILEKNPETAPAIARMGSECLGVKPMSSVDGSARASIAALSDLFFNKLGLKPTFTDLGIDQSKFDRMAEDVLTDPFAFGGSRAETIDGITSLSHEDIVNIFRKCL